MVKCKDAYSFNLVFWCPLWEEFSTDATFQLAPPPDLADLPQKLARTATALVFNNKVQAQRIPSSDTD